SHDLRAPLRHIGGYADLLQRHVGASLDEKGKRYVLAISQSTTQMGALIDDLLSFSRFARVDLQKSTVSLESLVGNVIRDLQPDAGRKVVWQIGPLPTVVA